jgi:hypothetical protein
MSAQGFYAQSVYVPAPRPENPRQRSNSLPIGLASMNAEEAGMLFSAAEKATARRRRIVSVDSPAWSESPCTSPNSFPMPSVSTIKPSPLSQFMSFSGVHASESAQADLRAHRESLRNFETDQNAVALESPDFMLSPQLSLPISPRRQVASRPLKDYADGLFMFTQSRLTTTIPQPPPTAIPCVPDLQINEEPVSRQLDFFPRPALMSHFSDWSTNTGSDGLDSSRRASMTTPPELDISLMSPDSFFGPGNASSTPKLGYSGASSSRTYASSPTYDPPSELPARTPPSRAQFPVQSQMEEFSYFTNFDQYYNRDSIDTVQPASPDALVIDLSPDDDSPAVPVAAPRRPRTDTAVRDAAVQRRCCGTPGSGNVSTPSTPFDRGVHIAEVAVRIPHWLVGAIG